MSKSIHSLLPDAETLLALEPEELAGFVIEHLNSYQSDEGSPNRYNFSLPGRYMEYPREKREEISKALMEAWVWLEREGLIAPSPGKEGEWVFVTRRGKRIQTTEQLKAYQHSNILPQGRVHPVIAQKVWSSFLRGDYDTAVFQAFKEVEVAVRTASSLPATDIGVALMRRAFDISNDPLRDATATQAEREAMQHLFAGAIGSFKNPQSHRNVSVEDPVVAVEMIMIACHLLRIVDSRTKP